jgi:predicted nucleic acid-binding protein
VTYLLDTNIISDLMRSDPRTERWLTGLDAEDRIVICTIVRGEILFGIARLPQGKRRAELEQTGRQFLEAFHCESLPEAAGDIYARLKVARQQRGAALDENDLWVAATALSMRAVLVSRDTDFAGVEGLTVIDLG